MLARRRAELSLIEESLTAEAGAVAELRYRLRNDGNAQDTFQVTLAAPSSWRVEAPVVLVALEPGEQRVGTLRAGVPSSAAGAREHLMRVTVTGTEVRETASATVTIVMPEAALGSLATVPGTIFIGSTSGDGEALAGVALTAAGEVRPGVRLRLQARHTDQLSPAHVFRGALSGPRLRLDLDGGSWDARAGDIFSMPDLVTGPVSQGRGVEGSYSVGALHTEIFLARPWSYVRHDEEGHLLQASARYRTGHGSFGVRAGSAERRDDLLEGYRQAGGVLTYSLRGDGHDLDVEAGVLEVGTDSLSRVGPTAELRYALSSGRISVAARLRRVPGTTARTASQGNEASFMGSYGLTRTLRLTGSAYTTDASRMDGAASRTSRSAALGLRLGSPTGFTARVLGSYRASGYDGSPLQGRETRAVTLGADLPVGPVSLQATADLGRDAVSDRAYRTTRLGGRWSGSGQWAWIGFSHYDPGLGSPRAGLDMSGALRFGGAEVEAGLNTAISGADRLRRSSLWSGATVPVLRDTELSAGAEYRGYAADRWRFSLGARRSFGMPLPLKKAPVLEGIVFQDLNADGVRGPGEPGLPGIGVSLGRLHATTDSDGRFRFYDAVAGSLRVDPFGLPMGVAITDGAALPTRGTATIGVVSAASLELRVFLDRNDDGIQGAEESFASGALVTIADARGISRDAVTDRSGRASFSGLPPGAYSVLVHRPNGRAARPPVELEVVLQPGATEHIPVAVPYRSREIRLPDGARLEPGPPTTELPALPVQAAEPVEPVEAAETEASTVRTAPLLLLAPGLVAADLRRRKLDPHLQEPFSASRA